MVISRDISPRTGHPYVPLSVLQASQWSQAELRHHIFTHRSNGASPPRSPTSPNTTNNANDHKLGLGLPARDLVATLHPDEYKRLMHPVPEDWSLRIGDCTTLDGGLDPLFETIAPELYPPSTESNNKKTPPPATEVTFFGLRQSARFPDEAVAEADKERNSNTRWTAYPPFRFGVEFWDVDVLKEKSRLHSQTVWYAGSLYNVYVQLVRKKGIQLGVYLHRQSSVDPVPYISAPAPTALPASAPSLVPAPASVGMGVTPSSTTSTARPSSGYSQSSSTPGLPISRSVTPVTPGSPAISRSFPSSLAQGSTPASYTSPTAPSSSSLTSPVTTSTTLPNTVLAVMPTQAYRDPRSAVSAYFSVACASATGGSLTRFTSAPDVFSVSQSWGWKSSSLRTEEYIEISEGGNGQAELQQSGSGAVSQIGRPRGAKGREVSLRATVVLGVV